ncbi:hypothetical protein [Sandaracinobacteroides saxicola]|uniref:Uncharacterized protein n=1 Tax=Sandaracinobacteroides saxicola TaxID=2759707 RepID=A0A7G5IHY5_9SPHN|nr:hypothetical protein [Sandaracinobacteroides saxicola]QMW22977.1 hypothetical protein H3309_00215 [Sandaracinobacteroides saxicola]
MQNKLKEMDKKACNGEIIKDIEFAHEKFAKSVLSMFWRAAISNSGMYEYFSVGHNLSVLMKSILKDSQLSCLSSFYVRVFRLIDRCFDGEVGFSPSALSNFIFMPALVDLSLLSFSHAELQNTTPECVKMIMVIKGFYIEVCYPNFFYLGFNMSGFLRPYGELLTIPVVDIFEFPMIVDAMVKGYEAHVKRKVSHSVAKSSAGP